MNTTTRSAELRAISPTTEPSSSHIAPLIAFFLAGRSSVIVTDAAGAVDPQALVRQGSCRRRNLPSPRTILKVVGFNPYRRFRARTGDYVMVAAAIALAVALVIWAVFG